MSIDELTQQVGHFEEKVDQRFVEVDRRFGEVDQRLDQVDRRFERFEDRVDRRFARLEDKVDAGFAWANDRFVTKEDLAKFEGVTTARFDSLDKRLDRWGRTVATGMAAIAVAVILKLLGVHA